MAIVCYYQNVVISGALLYPAQGPGSICLQALATAGGDSWPSCAEAVQQQQQQRPSGIPGANL